MTHEPDATGPSTSDPPIQSVTQYWAYRWRVRLSALVLLGTWIAVLMSEPWIAPGSAWAVLADYFGWVIFVGAICLRLWATANIGGRKSQQLVNHGPYTFCRNPLYVGTFMMMMSESLFLKSITFAAATLILFVFYHLAVVPVEENVLRARFGREYEDYCDAVPRWCPRRTALFVPPVTVAPDPWNAELRRTGWWLALPLIGTWTTLSQHHPSWPHLWFFP